MSDYEQRVLDEHADLHEKISKLILFFKTEVFESLSNVDQTLLVQQVSQMRSYSATLAMRINRFKS